MKKPIIKVDTNSFYIHLDMHIIIIFTHMVISA